MLNFPCTNGIRNLFDLASDRNVEGEVVRDLAFAAVSNRQRWGPRLRLVTRRRDREQTTLSPALGVGPVGDATGALRLLVALVEEVGHGPPDGLGCLGPRRVEAGQQAGVEQPGVDTVDDLLDQGRDGVRLLVADRRVPKPRSSRSWTPPATGMTSRSGATSVISRSTTT
jgi:hypothetical protein